MGMLGQLFGGMPAGPKADYSVAGDSGRQTRERTTDQANRASQTRGQDMSFIASILPELMGQLGFKDQLNTQMNAQTEMERRSKLGTPMGRAGMYNNPVQQFGQGLTAVQEGTPNFGSFSEGWGGTPMSHQQGGMQDQASWWKKFFGGNNSQGYAGKKTNKNAKAWQDMNSYFAQNPLK